jgi:hypothetical protein
VRLEGLLKDCSTPKRNLIAIINAKLFTVPVTRLDALQRMHAIPKRILLLNLSTSYPANTPETENAIVNAAPDIKP